MRSRSLHANFLPLMTKHAELCQNEEQWRDHHERCHVLSRGASKSIARFTTTAGLTYILLHTVFMWVWRSFFAVTYSSDHQSSSDSSDICRRDLASAALEKRSPIEGSDSPAVCSKHTAVNFTLVDGIELDLNRRNLSDSRHGKRRCSFFVLLVNALRRPICIIV